MCCLPLCGDRALPTQPVIPCSKVWSKLTAWKKINKDFHFLPCNEKLHSTFSPCCIYLKYSLKYSHAAIYHNAQKLFTLGFSQSKQLKLNQNNYFLFTDKTYRHLTSYNFTALSPVPVKVHIRTRNFFHLEERDWERQWQMSCINFVVYFPPRKCEITLLNQVVIWPLISMQLTSPSKLMGFRICMRRVYPQSFA